MVHVQLLQIEIQNLKDALDASQKKAVRYSQLVTTLYDELDKLRMSICHDCKKKLAPGSLSDPAPSPGLNVSAATSSTSDPFCLPPIDNTRSGSQTNSLTSSSTPAISLSTSETTPNTTIDISATNPGPQQTQFSPKTVCPEFSVEYNPDVKRNLDLHLEHVFAHEYPAWRVKISPDGQKMAVGFRNSGATIISNTKTRSNVRVFVDRHVKDKLLIRSVKFSPDGRLLATGATDHRIRIWDIRQNRMRSMFKLHWNEVNCVSFSPDGRSLVSASDDPSVRIWNIRDGSSKDLPVTDDARYFLSVVFSPNGWYIAAGDWKHSIWIWDSRTHKLVANWKGHSGCVWCVEFTPDGKGLMSGSADKTVKYWDVSSLGIHGTASGRGAVVLGNSFPLIRSFSGHSGAVYSIAFFTSNNEWIITGSEDKYVFVWDIRTGVWQLVVQGHGKSVMAVDISGTENFLTTASQDCNVALWRYKVL